MIYRDMLANQVTGNGQDSVEAYAGSLYSALEKISAIKIIHETVREFFLEDGFAALNEVSTDGVSCHEADEVERHATIECIE
jgi:hypothetical protein